MNLMLMGLPGAGKGTQAEKIVDKYHVIHISTGDMFREAMAQETPVGLKAKGFIDQGNLVPDSVTNEIVKERLAQSDVFQAGYMLDGFPRNLDQAKALDQINQDLNLNLDAVIDIQVDKNLLIDRLSGRFICRDCGATYHKLNNPTKVAGICDRCGGTDFYQRDDDKPETVKNRLDVNIKMNTPLIDYYQKAGVLHQVNGAQEIDQVFVEIDKILNAIN
ncbi:adenylate kinase [Bombilactobacillus folatiphilus]|uniref:Adenylate kinase n=1 Tax=Bombilactobacillus folatiphilus TaxID=2923362 RepID=A0ABY4P9Z9_9LACO|nr:adenylate kinase [Bombilactobacillus folatiphilus]UQS82374.1 adenylate kinase [Bombilactobacillus folatiphilus]